MFMFILPIVLSGEAVKKIKNSIQKFSNNNAIDNKNKNVKNISFAISALIGEAIKEFQI